MRIKNNKFIFYVLILLILFFPSLPSLSQTEESNCIICAQFVPECGENETLILQTCEACAHCELKENSSSSGSVSCPNPCGKKCCKANKKCITIDPCKNKTNCTKLLKNKCVREKITN